MFVVDTYDVIVIGAGHAGCEAALASARLGAKTLMATLNLDNIALMPCNPAVGGPGKSHLVREIDALGGEMGINTDKTCLQMRMLNTGKGPAVYSLRAQSDKKMYQLAMTKTLENQENLDVKQLMITDLLVEDGAVIGVRTELDEVYKAKCVILATGTYLKGENHHRHLHLFRRPHRPALGRRPVGVAPQGGPQAHALQDRDAGPRRPPHPADG